MTVEFKEISKMRKRMEKQLSNTQDIERAYEGLFLYVVTIFENYLEMIFFQILQKKLKGKIGYKVSPSRNIKFDTKISEGQIIGYILGEKGGKNGYLDWLRIEDINKRAELYLHEGRPFKDILSNNSTKDTFKKISLIRNYIAHKSQSSHNGLTKEIGTFSSLYSLLSSEHSKKTTYFDYILRELNLICFGIYSKLDI